MSEHLLSYKSLIFSIVFQGHPLRTKGDKDVLGIVQEFLLPSLNPQELHEQDIGVLEKEEGALHIFSVPLDFVF